MSDSSQLKITQFIQDIQSVNPEQADIIEEIRKLFLQADPALLQEIKYGGLTFFQNGSLIGGVFPYQKHLSIEFSYGVDFTDSESQLEGQGKQRRHLKIYTAADLTEKQAAYFIQQAVDNHNNCKYST